MNPLTLLSFVTVAIAHNRSTTQIPSAVLFGGTDSNLSWNSSETSFHTEMHTYSNISNPSPIQPVIITAENLEDFDFSVQSTGVDMKYFGGSNLPSSSSNPGKSSPILSSGVDFKDVSSINLEDITTFTLKKREDFNATIMDQVLRMNPKAVVRFLESKTFIMADPSLILKKTRKELMLFVKKGRELLYVEYDYSESSESYIDESIKIAASPCLVSNDEKSVQNAVSVVYHMGTGFSTNAGAAVSIGGKLSPLSLGFNADGGIGGGFGTKDTILGKLYCHAAGDIPSRILISPSVRDVVEKRRNIYYSPRTALIVQSQWSAPAFSRIFTSDQPLYYCGSQKEIDLRCEETYVSIFQVPGIIGSLRVST